MSNNNLTKGNEWHNLIRFAIPYMIACFLQTFYGLADLFIVGQFNKAAAITAVSVGSQVMHMVTVIIVGLAMGTTVMISRAAGSGDERLVKKSVGNSVLLFLIAAFAVTLVTMLGINGIVSVLKVPAKAVTGTRQYLLVCFLGIIFITAYNVICSIFRGLGDSKTPMYFVAVAGVLNIGLDYILVGPYNMGALGAAIATVMSQAVSVIIALIYAMKYVPQMRISKADCIPDRQLFGNIMKIGVPIAVQDGFIQIAFLVITIIANMRGLEEAAAVGIVEKLISFMFLVPSAMLSAVSTITAANIGAGTPERGRKTLYYALSICIGVGILFSVVCNIFSEEILRVFARDDEAVITLGGQYLRAYVFDCIAAGIHFCFSGYFCALGKSWISFLHNSVSIIAVRIPGAYLTSIWFPETLYPMGLVVPLGSTLSAVICVIFFRRLLLCQQSKLIE